MKTVMKMKRKVHPNNPNSLITEYSYIFAPFLKYFEIQFYFALF